MIRFVQTGWACPEQYDAYKGERKVGYLRLRHGHFRVDYPNCGGEVLYSAYPIGDGCFDADERDEYLTAAAEAIEKKLGCTGPVKYTLENFIDPITWQE